MDTTFATGLPTRLAQLGLNDDQLLVAAAYMQSAESLATIRYKVVAYNLLLLLAAIVSARLMKNAPAVFGEMRYLFDIVEHVAPVIAALALLATLAGGFLLNRYLASTDLPSEAKGHLRKVAARMDGYVLKRLCRNVTGSFRHH